MSHVFQSTLPQGKWLISLIKNQLRYRFNPHFRKGSDNIASQNTAKSQVSIHTSAREVTCRSDLWGMHSTGFNPHFRKGSDLSHCSAFQSGSCFNPHFRKGSDNRKQDVRELTEVSIHTSAREVTNDKLYLDWITLVSIHTSAREVTPWGVFPPQSCLFQSTLPQGKWPGNRWCDKWQCKFQSTLPQGKWLRKNGEFAEKYLFQSTLPQGKWRSYQRVIWQQGGVSIHTSAREVTHRAVFLEQVWEFQSTLPQGKWHRHLVYICIFSGFNPHFRKGSDRNPVSWWLPYPCFNPHFRKGSDYIHISIVCWV